MWQNPLKWRSGKNAFLPPLKILINWNESRRQIATAGTSLGGSVCYGVRQPVVDVIKVTTAVAYGRKLLGQCYKTFIRS